MKHTELLKLENKPAFAHGIVIDEVPEQFVQDENFKEIGIVARLDNGANDFDVIDACIGYISNDVKVILEVPFDQDFNEDTLISEAMVTGYDLSIHPPYDFGSEEGMTEDEIRAAEAEIWEKYKQKLVNYTKAWLSYPNMTSSLYPVSGFLGYMVSEVFGYKPNSITEDPYIQNVYVNNIPADVMDDIKDELRIVIYEAFGGKEKFEVYAHSLASAVVDSFPKYKSNFKRFTYRVKSYREKLFR